MIYDKISNWKTYFKHPKFEEIFAELANYNTSTENGVYHHEDFYFKVMEYDTKEAPEIIESHRKEVDIQILLTGSEKIKMYHDSDLTVSEAYNPETDCVFYSTKAEPYTELILYPEYMAVFFPSDPHHPQFKTKNGIQALKKIVIKVSITLF